MEPNKSVGRNPLPFSNYSGGQIPASSDGKVHIQLIQGDSKLVSEQLFSIREPSSPPIKKAKAFLSLSSLQLASESPEAYGRYLEELLSIVSQDYVFFKNITAEAQARLQHALLRIVALYLSRPDDYKDVLEKFGVYLKTLNIISADLLSILDHLPNIEHLSIADQFLDEETLETTLVGLPKLKSIDLQSNEALQLDLSLFCRFSNVELLYFRGTDEAPFTLFCSHSSSLKFSELTLDGVLTQPGLFKEIAAMPHLRTLILRNMSKLTPEELEGLSESKTLSALTLENIQFYFISQNHLSASQEPISGSTRKPSREWFRSFRNTLLHVKMQIKIGSREINLDQLDEFEKEPTPHILSIHLPAPFSSNLSKETLIFPASSFDGRQADKLFKEIELLEDKEEYFSKHQAYRYTESNRYSDVFYYDRNSLNSQLGYPINASVMASVIESEKLLVTQGPLERTIGDFWHMVWTRGTSLILMLTQCSEKGVDKCFQYWPAMVGDSATYVSSTGHAVEVTLASDEMKQTGFTRTFAISDGVSTRTVTQEHVTDWNDMQPYSAERLWELVQQVRLHQKQTPGELIVHCSASTGRTGVFVGCYRIEQLIRFVRSQFGERFNWDVLTLDPKKLVISLRQDRPKMIRNGSQLLSAIQFFIEAEKHWKEI